MLTVRFWAGARAAAGTSEQLAAPAPLEDLLAELTVQHPDLGRVLASCSFLLDGSQLHRGTPDPLPAGGVLDVLPPFAGG